jgi:hypothetical protein
MSETPLTFEEMAEMVSTMRRQLMLLKTRRLDGVSGSHQKSLDKAIERIEAAVDHFERILRARSMRP